MAVLRAMILLAAAATALSPIAAQEPTAPGEPNAEDMSGEEIFGPDYLPGEPEDPGEPLLVGRPSAGFTVAGAPITQKRLDPRFLTIDRKTQTPVPLRRSIQKQFRLPKFKRDHLPRDLSDAGRFEAIRATGAAVMKVHYVNVGQGAGAIVEFPKGCGIAVIDTGGEFLTSTDGGAMFAAYLNKFFDARPYLGRTIDALYTSHPHMDHMSGLIAMNGPAGLAIRGRPIVVRNIVDNGQTGTKKMVGRQTSIRDAARKAGAGYSAVRLHDQYSATGSTNKVIDPFACQPVDPIVTAFWGSRNEMVTGAASSRVHAYTSPNEHSVVIRIDFDKASFLFTGDLMKDGLRDMLAEHRTNRGVFRADVYLAGHHGADNGTSRDLLEEVKPRIAIISMGERLPQKPHTAWDHGHPRMSTIGLLQGTYGASDQRPPVTYWAATGDGTETNRDNFRDVDVKRAIYATGWEGSLIVEARSDGTYKVEPVTP